MGAWANSGAKPGTAGRWTERGINILKLAALADSRKWMEERERDPDGERGDIVGQLEKGKTPKWEGSGFSPDGAHVGSRGLDGLTVAITKGLGYSSLRGQVGILGLILRSVAHRHTVVYELLANAAFGRTKLGS